MVTNKLDEQAVRDQADTLSFPSSVVEYFQGAIGIPHGGFPQPLQSQVVKDLPVFSGRPYAPPPTCPPAFCHRLPHAHHPLHPPPPPGLTRPALPSATPSAIASPLVPPLLASPLMHPPLWSVVSGAELPPLDLDAAMSNLRDKYGSEVSETDLMSWVMYPKVYEQYKADIDAFGDVGKLPTRAFIEPMDLGEEISVELEKGKTLGIALKAVGKMDPKTGIREVFFDFNGMPRSVRIEDRQAASTKISRPKAIQGDLGSVGAPMPGGVVETRVKVGDTVAAGTRLTHRAWSPHALPHAIDRPSPLPASSHQSLDRPSPPAGSWTLQVTRWWSSAQ